eukprot:CAMPEP_0201501864 /NCGR_PEP_ID=MMETSP0151_2-20130828/83823_1 /ASSEMBLY_ACC=CAM_ASM_000257 /TAXON_ID=200890 /ORGANISM="Paramoeba atlantica, Strain 621/1 / CCAP 1560/9" /LENGTH=319 /DNA_ID=CAMNT_0047895409 /DNA_START=1334 /DNA_END=2293 /DNA_ORIENTATION=+
MNHAKSAVCVWCQRALDDKCQLVEFKILNGDWKCGECLTINFRVRSSCYRCSAKKTEHCEIINLALRNKEWICAECNVMNFSKRNDCVRCGNKKKEVNIVHPADHWKCVACEATNFRHHPYCDACDLKLNPTGSLNFVPGDWKCLSCRNYNKKDDKKCHSCTKEKDHTAMIVPDVKSSDSNSWLCKCGTINKNETTTCNACSTSSVSRMYPHNSDWHCAKCDAENYAYRTICMSCHMRRTSPKPKTSLYESTVKKKPVPCHLCGTLNYSWRTYCYVCHNRWGEEAQSQPSSEFWNEDGEAPTEVCSSSDADPTSVTIAA